MRGAISILFVFFPLNKGPVEFLLSGMQSYSDQRFHAAYPEAQADSQDPDILTEHQQCEKPDTEYQTLSVFVAMVLALLLGVPRTA